MSIVEAVPILDCPDVAASVAHFCDVLGFTSEFTWGDPPTYAGVTRDDADVHLRQGAPGATDGARIAFVVTEIDSLCDEFRSRGAMVAEPLEERPYGMRDFSIRTPDGHVLVFGQELDT